MEARLKWCTDSLSSVPIIPQSTILDFLKVTEGHFEFATCFYNPPLDMSGKILFSLWVGCFWKVRAIWQPSKEEGRSDEQPHIEELKQSMDRWKMLARNTLWLFNIAMENCPFTDALPIKKVIFHGYVK